MTVHGTFVWVGVLAWLVLAAVSVEHVLRRDAPRRVGRAARRAMLVVATVCTAVPGGSMAMAVATSDDGALQAGANWARNQGFGWLVDPLERWRYAEPPSTVPATALPLVIAPTTTAAPVSSTSTAPERTAPSTMAPQPFAPSNLAPVLSTPLDGEGVWVPLPVPGGADTMWVTSLRPLTAAASVTATYVYIRQDRLRARMYGGTELPGGEGWTYMARVSAEDRSAVVAAFNGGFRFEHIAGGYKTEGRVVEPLVDGEATLAIDAAGRITIGEYGRDLTDDGTWVSLRQGHRLLVDGGVSMATTRYTTEWGVDFGNETYTLRSALCQVDTGDLVYVIAGKVDAMLFGDVLVGAGCQTAMQLDINGTWPQFAYYDGLATTDRTAVLVDSRMGNPSRYLNGSTKDFFALFVADSPG